MLLLSPWRCHRAKVLLRYRARVVAGMPPVQSKQVFVNALQWEWDITVLLEMTVVTRAPLVNTRTRWMLRNVLVVRLVDTLPTRAPASATTARLDRIQKFPAPRPAKRVIPPITTGRAQTLP